MPFLPVLGLVAGIVGGIASAGVGVMGAIGARQQAQYQAASMQANAQAQMQNAQWARMSANNDARLAEVQNKRMLGSQMAAIGASGVDLTGSPLDLLSETVSESKIQEENIRRTGEAQARGSEFQAASFRMQAQGATQAGNTGFIGGLLGAGSSLLTSVGSSAMNFNYSNNLTKYAQQGGSVSPGYGARGLYGP